MKEGRRVRGEEKEVTWRNRRREEEDVKEVDERRIRGLGGSEEG